MLRQFAHGSIHGKMIMLGQSAQQVIGHGTGRARIPPAHAGDCALVQGFVAVRNAQVGADFHQRAQPRAGRTCTIGIVEGKHARGQFLNIYAAVRAGVVLRKLRFLPGFDLLHGDKPAALLQRRFQAVGQALADVRAHHQTVHHDLDGVLLLLVQCGRIVQLIHFAVNAYAQETVLERLLHQLCVLPLAGAHDGRKQLNLGAFRQGKHGLHHFIHALLADFPPAYGAVRDTRTGIQKAQIIMNFRHRAHGGARVSGGGFLIDGNGRGQPFDQIHIGLIHLSQKLPCIGRHAFHIAALTLCIDGIKGKAAFARA